MVKKTTKKKTVKKKVVPKLSEEEFEELQQEGELPKKSVREIENKQIIGFFIVVGLVFAAFLIPYFYAQSQKTFDYLGLVWSVETYDELTIYHSKVPMVYRGQVISANNVYLRNDPRENTIDVDFDFFNPKKVYVSYTEESASCYGQNLVGSLLSQFYSGFPFVESVEGAAATDEFAEKYDYATVNCINATSDNLVVIVTQGDESKVYSDAGHPNCVIIESNDCKNNLLVAEGFVLDILRQLEFVKVKWN